MIKTVVFTILPLIVLAAGALASQPALSVTKNLSSMPLAFTENLGQWDAKVKFRADADGAVMWFTTDGAYYQFIRQIKTDTEQAGGGPLLAVGSDRFEHEPDKFETMMIKANFVGSNPAPGMVGESMMAYKCNYFIGNDPSQWRTDVANYSAVVYEDIYPGIDLKYYGNGNQMEYDFIVSPGTDFSRIKIRYEGVESLSVNADGELVVTTVWGEVIERRPAVYQTHNGQQVTLDGRYELGGDNSFGFTVEDNYDRTLPLVIDPVLEYSTYLGGSGNEASEAIAVDATGAAYVTGNTSSTDFPTESGYQETFQGGFEDAFVTKLSSDGSALVYSTYLGGSDTDYGRSIVVDSAGSAYVTGYTLSADFPLGNPYQTYQGSEDAFVTKLSPSGNSLVYSTYLGGSELDRGHGIALDGSGSAYVTGETFSTDFPLVYPYQTNQFAEDVFVTKLSAGGNSLLYSTYLGGVGGDIGYGIAVDESGAAYVTGQTASPDFPTQGAYQADNRGEWDVFVSKLNAGGNNLVYSTFLGGSHMDWGHSIAIDSSGAAYVTGLTTSDDFPTVNGYEETYQGGFFDAFVAKLNASGSSLIYSTYLGGSDQDAGWGIAVDVVGAAYVTGHTASTDFPTVNPYQATYQGTSYDAFVTKLGAIGDNLAYSTYLWGSGGGMGLGIAVDSSGAAYVTGLTSSDNFPTLNPYQSGVGLADAFVTKLVEICCFLRGDVNRDASVDPLDAAYFVNYLWLGGPPPPCMDEADVDGSGGVDPLDALYLVNYFWNGGPPPVPCP